MGLSSVRVFENFLVVTFRYFYCWNFHPFPQASNKVPLKVAATFCLCHGGLRAGSVPQAGSDAIEEKARQPEENQCDSLK